MVTVKKYGNRRLYDMSESRYITLDELRDIIRKGQDVRVIDAKTDEDLTAVTLTQILMEGRGAARMLPVPLLTQLVRMGDDALAEFFGRYVTWTLDSYLKLKQGAQQMATINPLMMAPFAATDALARFIGGARGGDRLRDRGPYGTAWENLPDNTAARPPAPPAPTPTPPPPPPTDDVAEVAGDVAALRRELQELKSLLKPAAKKRR